MPRNYKKQREKITFEALMQVLSTHALQHEQEVKRAEEGQGS